MESLNERLAAQGRLNEIENADLAYAKGLIERLSLRIDRVNEERDAALKELDALRKNEARYITVPYSEEMKAELLELLSECGKQIVIPTPGDHEERERSIERLKEENAKDRKACQEIVLDLQKQLQCKSDELAEEKRLHEISQRQCSQALADNEELGRCNMKLQKSVDAEQKALQETRGELRAMKAYGDALCQQIRELGSKPLTPGEVKRKNEVMPCPLCGNGQVDLDEGGEVNEPGTSFEARVMCANPECHCRVSVIARATVGTPVGKEAAEAAMNEAVRRWNARVEGNY